MLDSSAWERTFRQTLELWVNPEIERRRARGVLEDPFLLFAAQVIFPPKESLSIEVRLNRELNAKFAVTPYDKSKNWKDETFIPLSEVESVKHVELVEEESDYAHITILRLQESWYLGFDLRYNKQKALQHTEIAQQFIESAELAMEDKRWNAFLDSAYSAAELLAKGVLMLMPDERINTHRAIQPKFSRFVEIGNAPIEYKNTLNKLSGWRHDARYGGRVVELSEEEAEELLETIKSMKKYLQDRAI